MKNNLIRILKQSSWAEISKYHGIAPLQLDCEIKDLVNDILKTYKVMKRTKNMIPYGRKMSLMCTWCRYHKPNKQYCYGASLNQLEPLNKKEKKCWRFTKR